MNFYTSFIFILCLHLADFTQPACEIHLECRECLPEHMPLVLSHNAINGSIAVPSGGESVFTCSGKKFSAYPLLETITTLCQDGFFKVQKTGEIKHLLDLGCQGNVFEDVPYQVERCGLPLQGRAYQIQEHGGNVRQLATICYDEDRGIAVRIQLGRMTRPTPRSSPLSLLANFNFMFDAKTQYDAEVLYSNEKLMNGRLQEMFRHDRVSFAGQTLTTDVLLSGKYFLDEQQARVSQLVTNRVPVWGSVSFGNLRHLHRDVTELVKLSRPHDQIHIYTGTHGVQTMRVGNTRKAVYLSSNRFPVPKYIWTVVHSEKRQQATALVLLNDPFISVSEIKDAVFCESTCGSVLWLHELRRHRHYDTPINGLVFCCSLHNLTRVVTEMPKDLISVQDDISGILTVPPYIPL